MWAVFHQNEKESERGKSTYFRMDNLEVDSLGLITARISNINIHDVVQDLCQKLNLNYFFIDNLERSTGIFVEKVNFDSFLKVIFTGTNFTWRVDNGIYMFGKENQGTSLSTARVIPMKFRSVDKVMTIIPKDLSQAMEILPFPDLNSLVVNGEQSRVIQLMTYLNEIDKSVPLISIDVIILDATNTNAQEIGISMGLGKEPATTSGSLSPGVNMTLGASSVNKLINSFNGFSSINLGRVTPNFYMGLKLLEEDGKIVIRSTPRLSTLNGHKATLKSGEMKYYKESQTYLTGTQNPIQSESYQWKNVEANLSLDITPYISTDSCITMQIDLTQSEFTEREEKDAPPGTTTRSFNSIIKVRNEEMVLLGGIERNQSSRTSSGLPFIARIPILRWIFGSSSKTQSTQKLNVFIKPTVIK
jgi:type IV pilus assembly protein PilQ